MPEYLFQNFHAREAKWATWMALCASETCSNSAFGHIHLKEQELFWLQKEFSIGKAGGKSWSLDLPVTVASIHLRFPARTERIYLHTNFAFWPQGTADTKNPKSLQSRSVWESRENLKAPKERKHFYGETTQRKQIKSGKISKHWRVLCNSSQNLERKHC